MYWKQTFTTTLGLSKKWRDAWEKQWILKKTNKKNPSMSKPGGSVKCARAVKCPRRTDELIERSHQTGEKIETEFDVPKIAVQLPYMNLQQNYLKIVSLPELV